MRLAARAMLGRYEVLAPIGAGGMGEVYRARDTRLDRIVALKIISSGFATDPSSHSRFDRERRVVAALDHPHICGLLDAGHAAGIDYLTFEFLQGETLAARVRRGPLPVRAALGHAIEVADALAYAHARGVLHRDLKPANVFLTDTGTKVLDFGLATLRASPHVPVSEETLPVATGPAILGSPLYMAPERLEGLEADARTDVFAFGVVLYEMLAGRRPFDGASPAAIVSAMLTAEPSPLALSVPAADEIEWVVRKCLARDPRDRWQSMADLRDILKRLARGGPVRASRPVLHKAAAAALVAGGVMAAAAALVFWSGEARGSEDAGAPVAFTVPPPAGGTFTPTESSVQTAQLALSADGRMLAFVAAAADGEPHLWVRTLDAVDARLVPGTTSAAYPFWSPDGRSVGFFARGELRRVDLAGGPPRTIAAAPNGRGGSWNADGTILFVPNTTGGIFRVSAQGGDPALQTHVDGSREVSHRWPFFLPDGRRYLFFVRSSQEAVEGVYLGSLDGSDKQRLVHSSFGGVYLHPDRLLYIADGTLLVRPLDRAEGSTDPVAVAEDVGGSSNFYSAVSASATGTIAYGGRAMTSDIAWFDREGRRTGTVAAGGQHVDFQLSPDGGLLALAEVNDDTELSDVFVLDLVRNTRERLTSSRATDASPVWSPDGTRLIFRSNREQNHDLYVRDAVRRTPERLFLQSPNAKYPTSWSAGGRLVLFHVRNDDTGWDVWLANPDDSAAARPLVNSRFDEVQAQLSRDAKWVAYTSDETSQFEVYVEPIAGGERRLLSTGGGSAPKWRSDGRELFYVSADGYLMSAPVDGSGHRLIAEQPRRLFSIGEPQLAPPYAASYDVAAANRFLVRVLTDHPRSLPLTVLLNWRPQAP